MTPFRHAFKPNSIFWQVVSLTATGLGILAWLWWEFSDYIDLAPPTVVVLNSQGKPAMRLPVQLREKTGGTLVNVDTNGQGELYFHRLPCSRGCDVLGLAYLETRRNWRGQETRYYSQRGPHIFVLTSAGGSPLAHFPFLLRYKTPKLREGSVRTDASGRVTIPNRALALTERNFELLPISSSASPGWHVQQIERHATSDSVEFRIAISPER